MELCEELRKGKWKLMLEEEHRKWKEDEEVRKLTEELFEEVREGKLDKVGDRCKKLPALHEAKITTVKTLFVVFFLLCLASLLKGWYLQILSTNMKDRKRTQIKYETQIQIYIAFSLSEI